VPAIAYRFSASGHADVARAFQSIAAAAAKAAAAEQRAAQTTVEAAAKAQRARERSTGSPFRDQGGNAADAGAKAEERAARRAADAKIREAERARRHVDGIRTRHFLAEQRQQEKLEQRAARRRAESIGTLKDVASGMFLGGMGAFGAAGMALVGGAARKQFALESKTRDIAISTRGSGQEAVDPGMLAKEFQRTAAASPGQTAEGIADAVKAFTTKTGDLATARKLQGTFATLASASGTDAKDIGASAADLMQKFGIKDEGEMQNALGKLYMQGKAGSFELSDAAAKFPMMAAAAQRFGLDKGAKGVATLGGLSQIARESTGSADQAGTAVEAMFRQLVSKSTDLKSKGVEVFQKNGQARDIQDVLVDTISKVGGNDLAAKKVGLQKVFGDEGIRAISPLIDAFAQAVKEGKDPVQALRDKLAAAIDVTGAWTDVQKDAATRQQSAEAKLSAAWESLSAKLGTSVTPVLTKFVEALNTPAFQSALDLLALNVDTVAWGMRELFKVLQEIPGIGDAFKPKAKPIEQQIEDKRAELAKFDEAVNARLAKDPTSDGLTKEEAAKEAKLNDELMALEMSRTLASAAGGTIDEASFRQGFDEVAAMSGQKENALKAMEAYNRGRPEGQQVQYDESAGKLVGSADALKASADALNEAARNMPKGGVPGDAPGEPLGGSGRRF
jgi:hypothetical protein